MMTRVAVAVVLGAVAVGGAAAVGSAATVGHTTGIGHTMAIAGASQDTVLGRVRWLAGCWERRRGERVTLEMWMPPAGGLMLGASRTTAGDAVREFEQLRLAAQGEGLVYTAVPSGQREASFSSVQVSDSGFTVENLAHDFPQRIIYRRRGADSLIARIEGPAQGTGTRGIDFPMRRVACTAP